MRGALPLSVDLASTVWALAVCGGALVVFVVSRRVFQGGGVRIAARGIATVGLLLAAECLAQDATGGGRMYWRWKPLSEGAPPFGPFVNRNHFATWVVMAAPLCIGYLLAHASAHRRHERETDRSTWHKRAARAGRRPIAVARRRRSVLCSSRSSRRCRARAWSD